MRDIDSASVAESQSDVVRPFIAIEMAYPDGTVRATSLDRDILIDGHTYYGLQALGTVSAITEGTEQRSYGVTATLSGVPGNFSEYLAGQNIQGRLATIKVGFVDRDYELVGVPTIATVGRMDTQDVTAGKTSSVQVAIESLLIDWQRPRSRRYSDLDQQTRYPGDRGLEYSAAMESMILQW